MNYTVCRLSFCDGFQFPVVAMTPEKEIIAIWEHGCDDTAEIELHTKFGMPLDLCTLWSFLAVTPTDLPSETWSAVVRPLLVEYDEKRKGHCLRDPEDRKEIDSPFLVQHFFDSVSVPSSETSAGVALVNNTKFITDF